MFIVYRVGKCAVRVNSLEMKACTTSLHIAVYEASIPPPKLFSLVQFLLGNEFLGIIAIRMQL